MFQRAISSATSAVLTLGAAAAVALVPAAAQADTPVHTGHLQIITDGQIQGCFDSGAYHGTRTNDPAAAATVSIAEGEGQDISITSGGFAGSALGVADADAAFPMNKDQMGYAFLAAVSRTPAGSVSVNDAQSAIWSIDPTTRELSATYVWDDGSTTATETWANSLYAGLTQDFSAVQANTMFRNWMPATFRIGAACSGPRDEPQAITLTSSAPSPAYPGQSYTVAATGGGSGNAVTFTSATAEICTVEDATVTFVAPGTCTVNADQAAAEGYSAAPTASQDITVSAIPSSIEVTPAATSVVTGQTTTATAQVDVVAGTITAAAGTVQFALDGTDLGSPVAIDEDGTAVSPAIGGSVGSHSVTATYVPAHASYLGTAGSTTVTVAAADTTTHVAVTGTGLTATVAPVAPGAGTPTGEVTFSVDGTDVGTATLTDGTASLAHVVPTDATHAVAAAYAGDASFNASSASTSRANPTITARLSSAKAPRGGWYRGPVTVTFTCSAKGAELVTACPAPATIAKQPGGRVSRTIQTTDGGIATVTATAKIDTSAPRVRVKGVKAGSSHFVAPKASCVATDTRSGVKTCRTSTKRKGSKVVVTATATDVAGNTASKRVSYRLAAYTIEGAKQRGGVWQVKQGETYTIVVRGARARYVYATPAPGRPHTGSVAFKAAGKGRWAVGVTMSMATSHTRSWNLGYTQGGKLHLVRVHVNR